MAPPGKGKPREKFLPARFRFDSIRLLGGRARCRRRRGARGVALADDDIERTTDRAKDGRCYDSDNQAKDASHGAGREPGCCATGITGRARTAERRTDGTKNQ